MFNKIAGKFVKKRNKLILKFSTDHPETIYQCKVDKKRFQDCK